MRRGPGAAGGASWRRRLLRGLVLGDGLLEILEPELQLVRAELLRPAAELPPQQALDQQPQLVVLGLCHLTPGLGSVTFSLQRYD